MTTEPRPRVNLIGQGRNLDTHICRNGAPRCPRLFRCFTAISHHAGVLATRRQLRSVPVVSEGI